MAFPITDSVGSGGFGLATVPILCFDKNGESVELEDKELNTVVKFPKNKAASKDFFAEYKKMPYRCRAGFTPGRTGIKQKRFPGEEMFNLLNDGSIANLVGENKSILVVSMVETILKQVTRLGYIHCDLKAENIIINLPDNEAKPWVPEINVIDYALAEFGDGVYTPKGTPPYVAPELVNEAPGELGKKVYYDQKIDVFSIALTLIDFYNITWHKQEALFSGPFLKDSSSLITFLAELQIIPEDVFEVFKGMLKAEPGARLTLEQAVLQLKKLGIKNELKKNPAFNVENFRFLENKCLAWIDQIYYSVVQSGVEIISDLLNDDTQILNTIMNKISQLSHEIQSKWLPGSQKRDLFNTAIDDYQQAVFLVGNEYVHQNHEDEDGSYLFEKLDFYCAPLLEVLCMHRKPTRDKALNFFKKESTPESYKIFIASECTPEKIKQLLVKSISFKNVLK